MKIVTEAEIEIIKRGDLKRGDEVLFRNQVWIVASEINPRFPSHEQRLEIHRKDKTEDTQNKKFFEWFSNWYKVISCTEIILCDCCFQSEVNISGKICKECTENSDVEEWC